MSDRARRVVERQTQGFSKDLCVGSFGQALQHLIGKGTVCERGQAEDDGIIRVSLHGAKERNWQMDLHRLELNLHGVVSNAVGVGGNVRSI